MVRCGTTHPSPLHDNHSRFPEPRFGCAILLDITSLFYQVVTHQTTDPAAGSILRGQLETAHHIFREKLLRQTLEGLYRLLTVLHIH